MKIFVYACLLAALNAPQSRAQTAHHRPSQRPPGPVAYPGPQTPPRPRPPLPAPGDLGQYLSAFDDASRGRLDSCRVSRFRWWSRPGGCVYRLRVNGRPYPDGRACSSAERSMPWGCAVGDQKANLGCLIVRAMREGRCR